MSALYEPRRARVRADATGRPTAVGSAMVEAIREEWLVEDRWWTPAPVARRYFEVVLESGSCEVIFTEANEWFRQRA